jgi:cytoskeleton protein RodZ
VTLAATDEVWLRVYDAENKTLYQGTMKQGDRFDVPAGAREPKINVGRPDKLQVTLNGSAVPPLGSGARPIKDVRVDAASIAARLSGAAASGATTTLSAGSGAAVAGSSPAAND